MDKGLMNSILEWPVATSVKEVQSFVWLASFYRRFIGGYANIIRPILDIIRKIKLMW